MRRKWTDDEIETVRINYANWPTYLIAYLVGRSERAVYQLALSRGWKKSPEYLAGPLSGRKRKGCKPSSTTFKPGQAPWNKGVKGSAGLHPNSRKTQFRKGHLSGRAAELVQPIGSLRIADGQLQRKVNNDRPFMRRWVAVSRLVWEAANGPIPDGYIVAFKRGMATTEESEITLDRLELISRAENMKRNSYHNYPQPIPQLIQLRGALQRQINKRASA